MDTNLPDTNNASFEENMHIQPESPVRSSASHEWKRFFRTHPKLVRWLPVVAVSVISSLVVLGIAAAAVWGFRAPIARALLASAPQVATLQTPNGEVTVPITETAPIDTQPHDLSVTEVVAKANPSVVSIEVSQAAATSSIGQFFPGLQQSAPKAKVVGGGSGFFVTADGLVVTNRHVVDFQNAIFTVITSSGKRYPAAVIARDPVLDIAMLRVTGGSGFTPATLGDSDTLELGQSVVAIGYALGEFKNSISTGVIAGLSRSIVAGGGGTTEQLDKVIQTDAAINPGNSGGPLLDLRGAVIGVNVAVAKGSQNVGFALPINSVRAVIDSVKRTGTIIRPYVGIQYVQITAQAQSKLNLPFDYGILVQQVVAGSPAERAGIQQGDIILSIDGTKLDSSTNFSSIVRGKSVGKSVTMQVYTGGVTKAVRVTLVQAPAS
jgi:serine protease Do